MATEVNFYHLTRSSLEAALPRLLAKTLQAGERAVVMLGSSERVDALNTHLWTYDPNGFLPHGAPVFLARTNRYCPRSSSRFSKA